MKALVALAAGLVLVLLAAGAIVYGSSNLNSPETQLAETATEQSGRDSLGSYGYCGVIEDESDSE